MKSISEMSRVELAGFVSGKLIDAGLHAVLSGGSCVSIYSNEKYVSMDLDFVNANMVHRKGFQAVMESLGFTEDNRYFKHPETEYFIEFPPGPLAVGEEPVKQIYEIETACGRLKILSPTDCVKDRLSWYFYNDDSECLQQAILVAKDHPVDLKEIRRWSKQEGMKVKYSDFEDLLKKEKS